MRRIPPLAAVRVFEAAARHENFTSAAAELGMTQAAVSYQIRLLEERLGVPLFRREKRRVVLTDAGRRAAAPIGRAFDAIDAAFAQLRTEDEGMLTISTSLTFALEEGKLLVWLGTNRDDAAVRTIAEKFTADLGVEVTVEVVDPDLPLKFQQAAATGDGPDIVLWPHDRFGEWAQAGLISPVEPSDAVKASALESAWDAVSFGGQIWGYPVFVEAIALIYNKALVPTPPKSFEEMLTLHDKLKARGIRAIGWETGSPYFTWPLMAAVSRLTARLARNRNKRG